MRESRCLMMEDCGASGASLTGFVTAVVLLFFTSLPIKIAQCWPVLPAVPFIENGNGVKGCSC